MWNALLQRTCNCKIRIRGRFCHNLHCRKRYSICKSVLQQKKKDLKTHCRHGADDISYLDRLSVVKSRRNCSQKLFRERYIHARAKKLPTDNGKFAKMCVIRPPRRHASGRGFLTGLGPHPTYIFISYFSKPSCVVLIPIGYTSGFHLLFPPSVSSTLLNVSHV